jgi:hypothetical protein
VDDPVSISDADLKKVLKSQYPWGTDDEKEASKFGNYLGKEDGYEGHRTRDELSAQPARHFRSRGQCMGVV